MRKTVLLIVFLFLFSLTVTAEDIQSDIYDELELERAEELIPESAESSEIDFSVKNTPSSNGLNITTLFKTVFKHFYTRLAEEISFIFFSIAILVLSSVTLSFIPTSSTALRSAVGFVISALTATVLTEHIENAFLHAQGYISEITAFMTGLLPFFGSLSVLGGEFASSAVQKAVLLSVIDLLQSFIGGVAVPICKAVTALSIAGYISGISLGAISEFITGIATKTVTVGCGIMGAVLYFQNTVSSVTDSLALRSVRLAAGSFIPIVGSFVSEASGTLISGVKLVSSTFGVFAICVLIYMSIGPIIGFLTVKVSMRFTGAVAKLLGCDREARVFTEISSVYNILSAVMIASACFFIFFITVFIQNGGK